MPVEVVAPAGGYRTEISSAVVQLQGYTDGRLDCLAAGGYDLAVIDLARDAGSAYFTSNELRRLQAPGTRVLAYFEIGSLENFRPDFASLRRRHPDLFLNEWSAWPGEYFVRYWDARWWDLAIRPRIDRALTTGFDGVFLDSTGAFEEIDGELVPGGSREALAERMADLIVAISAYGKASRAGFMVFPNNSPQLQRYPGYVNAIDGIAMESLFFRRTGARCDQPYCASDLESARALRAARKIVLAIDYTDAPDEIADVCDRYRREGFVGYVAEPALAGVRPPCS
jgi:cysteinyl-tRNA synthetase